MTALVPADGGAATGELGEDARQRLNSAIVMATSSNGYVVRTGDVEALDAVLDPVCEVVAALLAQARAEGEAKAARWAGRCASEQVRAERAEAALDQARAEGAAEGMRDCADQLMDALRLVRWDDIPPGVRGLPARWNGDAP